MIVPIADDHGEDTIELARERPGALEVGATGSIHAPSYAPEQGGFRRYGVARAQSTYRAVGFDGVLGVTAPSSARRACMGPDDETPPAPPTDDAPSEASGGPPAPRPRGFAAMDRARLAEVSRKGGRAVHDAGTAHEFSVAEARAAGQKGGRAHAAKRAAARVRQQAVADQDPDRDEE